jgi:hypothetical protein
MGLHKFILLNYCLRTGAFRKCPRTRENGAAGNRTIIFQSQRVKKSNDQIIKQSIVGRPLVDALADRLTDDGHRAGPGPRRAEGV